MDRQTAQKKAKQKIDDIFAKIEELELKKDKVQTEARETYNKKIAELNTKKTELQAKYDDLLNSAEDKWEESSSVFSASAEHFKKGFSELGNLFK
jgi:ABC-type phosphate transport system auxiliary subunit